MSAYFNPIPTYGVELFSESEPRIDKRRLITELQKYCPDIETLGKEDPNKLLAFVHPNHRVEYQDGSAPAQAFIVISDKPPDAAKLTSAIQQSWRLSNAAEVVASCRYSVLISDLMASGLEYRTRFDLFQRVLRAVLAVIPSQAIHWTQAEQIEGSDDFLSCSTGSLADLLGAGPINVRLFNIENSDGAVLMDTRGLSSFGLPDLQCHFRGLDAQPVARVLYNTAFYVFEYGDVIEDGQTVTGTEPSSRWICRHEDSLVGPDRVVLDLNPGIPYAAGNR